MRVIAYTRRSTDRQDLSHDAQVDAIRKARPDDDLSHVEDTCSGSKPLAERDGGRYALSLLSEGQADALVVSRLDRLARSTLDFASTVARAKAEGWSIICLDPAVDLSTSSGKLVADVLMAMAEFERSLIGDRTREGLAAARRRGAKVGGPAVNGDVAQRIVREFNGGASLSGIARGLNEDGVPTARHGTKWYPSTARSVLHRLGLLPTASQEH